jgi:hypothetical protein
LGSFKVKFKIGQSVYGTTGTGANEAGCTNLAIRLDYGYREEKKF